MYRDILTNKWILGGVAFLILFSFSCYLWYQHETAPYKQDATETAEIARQWEIEKSRTSNLVETASSQVPSDSTVSTTEKQINPITDADMRAITSDSTLAILTDQTQQLVTTEEVRVSPYGFGPYPKIPDGWPQGFFDRELSREEELLGRVRIKLFEQGSDAISVAIDDTGFVYPIEKNSVYITWGETSLPDLGVVKYITDILGDVAVLRQIEDNARIRDPNMPFPLQIEADIPEGVQLLTKNEEWFDPYEFLNLKR